MGGLEGGGGDGRKETNLELMLPRFSRRRWV